MKAMQSEVLRACGRSVGYPMSNACRRRVLRLSPELIEQIEQIQRRIQEETGQRFSQAAAVRGLLLKGLAAVEGQDALAKDFAKARMRPGRKR